jgi:hypothetical protein
MFNIIDPATNANVLGGAVDATNSYVALYPSICEGHKRVLDLEIGESTQAAYNLSGTKGVYLIVRVDDSEPAASRPLWMDADNVEVK